MAFCSNCGAQAEGKFCPKCGSPVAAGPGQTPPPAQPIAPAQAGLQDNMVAALCYLGSIITGILFLVIEPYNHNKTIRFHAFQSIFLWVACIVIYIVAGIFSFALGTLPIIGILFTVVLHGALFLAFFVLWLLLMYKAYNNERWVLPIIGPLAEKQA
jgi:uncharacterized membrane protein